MTDPVEGTFLGSVPQEPPIQARDASHYSENEIITLLTQIRDELRSIKDAVWKAANERDPLCELRYD